jgi:hypothetical protein
MTISFEADLIVREAHIDIFNRYAHALDARNWKALAALYTEDGVFSFARSLGVGAGIAEQATIEGRDKLVEMIASQIECLSATHHFMSNYVVDLDPGGEAAEASAYFRAYHAGRGERAHLFEESLGRFDLKTVKVGSEWKIRRMHENIMIMLGTADVFA